MTLGVLKPGDIVLADRKGRRFDALVLAREGRELEVLPIDPRVSCRHMTRARWPGSGARRAPRATAPSTC